MEKLSEKRDRELKEALKQKYSIRTSWGARRADFPEDLNFYWPHDREEYIERCERTAEFIKGLKFEDLYAVAFGGEQYAEYEKNFREKYGSASNSVRPEEVPEAAEDLIEVMIVPESLDWMIIFDHEGDICFNGDEAFIERVKSFFSDWKTLNEVPDRRFGT